MLCLDVLQMILEFADFKTQLNLISLDKSCYDNLKIINLDNIKITKKMTQEIITQKKYDSLRILKIVDNTDIYDISFLKNSLSELDCSGRNSLISQCNIDGLTKLCKLIARDNTKIYNVNHLADTLIKLDCSSGCGINQEGIMNLKKIQLLNTSFNPKIRSVNHLDSLIELYSYCYGLDQEGIKDLTNLKVLNVTNNRRITSVNHLSKLIELDCCYSSGIDQQGISNLKNLLMLNMRYNVSILNVDHLKNTLLNYDICNEQCQYNSSIGK
jgi:hypothetical protein